jgi:hypothetical protein
LALALVTGKANEIAASAAKTKAIFFIFFLQVNRFQVVQQQDNQNVVGTASAVF